MRAAAISWIIACGLVSGAAGTLGTVQAAADPGTGGSRQDNRDTGGGTDSNANTGDRPDRDPAAGGGGSAGDEGPVGEQTGGTSSEATPRPGRRIGAHRFPAAAVAADDSQPPDTEPVPGEGGEVPWPWPWPPCLGHNTRDLGIGNSPRQRLGRTATPPQGIPGGGGGGNGNGGGIAVTVPPPTVPGQPGEPTPVNAGGGTPEPPAAGEPPVIEMPPIIGAPPVLEVPLRPVGTPGSSGPAVETGPGGRPAPAKEPTPVRERPPAGVGNATEAPTSFRVGYPEYLREAKTGEVAALALPGVAGLLALTALGGVVGYRQARASHVVRAAGTARFLQ